MNDIKKYREKANMKQLDLAEMLNVSQGTLSNWERGIHDPDIESLMNIAHILHTTTDELLGNVDTQRTVLPELEGVQFALYNETKDFDEVEQRKVLEYVQFLRSQKEKETS